MKLLWISKNEGTKSKERDELMKIYNSIPFGANTNQELSSIYSSCVYKQIKDDSVEDVLISRALYFARALEDLFEYERRNVLLDEKNSKDLKKLQWLLYFEDPQIESEASKKNDLQIESKEPSENKFNYGLMKTQIAKKFIPDTLNPTASLILDPSFKAREQELVQEEQQETEQLMQQIQQLLNEQQLQGDYSLDNIPNPNPTLKISEKKSDKKYLPFVDVTEDWTTTHSKELTSPFEQGKMQLFLAEPKNLSHFLISQAEVERIFKEKLDYQIFSISNLGFENQELNIGLGCLLQHLAFSGSFSTFYEMLIQWGLTNYQNKEKLFETIANYFNNNEELKIELLKKSILYEKNASQVLFLLFLKQCRNLSEDIFQIENITIIIKPSDKSSINELTVIFN